ncbi:MAG: NADH-quinone oxidoreductase subunit C [Anaerolineae bacterium]
MSFDKLVVDRINTAVPNAIEEVQEFRGEQTLFIAKDKLKAVCQLLRDDEKLQFNFLSDICADDLLPEFPRFAVNYHLHSIPNKCPLRLRVL